MNINEKNKKQQELIDVLSSLQELLKDNKDDDSGFFSKFRR